MTEIVQVALRGSRKEFFLNSRSLWLRLRDPVIVQSEHGESFGTVFLKDPTLIELKRPGNVTHEIIRKAEEEDLDQEDRNRRREQEAFEYCRERIELRELSMDLAEVEVAFGGHRITFYFSAERRVDFRELVKDLAARLQARIELRQIGVRDQAKRLDLAQGLPSRHAQDGAGAAALAQSQQDLGRLRAADVLPRLRAGAVPRQRGAAAAGG